jgi:hypothetical protein
MDPPPAPTANTVGFVYVLDYASCTMVSSNSYAKFNNMGIRSVALSLHNPAGVAMLAYDDYGSTGGHGAIDGEYLITAPAMDIAGGGTTYHKIEGLGLSSSVYGLTGGGIQYFTFARPYFVSLYIVTSTQIKYWNSGDLHRRLHGRLLPPGGGAPPADDAPVVVENFNNKFITLADTIRSSYATTTHIYIAMTSNSKLVL